MRVLPYLRATVHRLGDPRGLRRGWPIASGAVASACTAGVNQRLCLGGMRWGEGGSDAAAHRRALYRSDPDQGDGFWRNAVQVQLPTNMTLTLREFGRPPKRLAPGLGTVGRGQQFLTFGGGQGGGEQAVHDTGADAGFRQQAPF